MSENVYLSRNERLLQSILPWVILLSSVLYRAALYFELRSIGFFRLLFVDNKATLDISLKLLEGESPGLLMKPSLWFIQYQAIFLKLGIGLEGLHLIQYLSGILLVMTVLTLGKRVFGSIPALIGGTILAFYGPLLFQESQLVTAPWGALFLSLAVLLPLGSGSAPKYYIWLLSGLLMGLGVQCQANMILAAGAFIIGSWFWLDKKNRFSLLAFPLGLLLALLPLTVNNLRAGEFIPLSALGGINFFIGNGPAANGFFSLPEGYSLVNEASEIGLSSLIYPSDVLGHRVNYGEASRFWTGATLKYMAAHPARSLKLLAKKAILLTQAWEVPNNLSYYFFRTQLVKLPLPFDYGLLIAFALPWFFQRRPTSARSPLVWVLGIYAFSVVIFFVVDRYRLPLVPLTALLAGAGILELKNRWQSGGILNVRIPAFLCLIALFFTHIPGWTSPQREVAHGWNSLGTQFYKEGRDEDAARAYARAIEADSSNARALFRLASIYAGRGEFENAEELYRRVLKVNSKNQKALVQLGRVLMDQGDPDGALEIFLSGITAHPENADFYEGAASAFLEKGQINRSVDILGKAAAMGLRNSALVLLEDQVRPMVSDTGDLVWPAAPDSD